MAIPNWTTLHPPVLALIAHYDLTNGVSGTCKTWCRALADPEKEACAKFIDWLPLSPSERTQAKENLKTPHTVKIVRALAEKMLPQLIVWAYELGGGDAKASRPPIPVGFRKFEELKAFYTKTDFSRLDNVEKIGACLESLEKGFIDEGMDLLRCRMEAEFFGEVTQQAALYLDVQSLSTWIEQQEKDLQWRGRQGLLGCISGLIKEGKFKKAAELTSGIAVHVLTQDAQEGGFSIREPLENFLIAPLDQSLDPRCQIEAQRLSNEVYEEYWRQEYS